MSKKGKQSAEGSGKKRKGASPPRNAADVRLSQHPRARQQIRMAKGWAGLAGCALAGYASWHGGAPFFDTVLRALLWGVAAYMLVWFCAVQVWRHIAIAEVRAAEKVWRAAQGGGRADRARAHRSGTGGPGDGREPAGDDASAPTTACSRAPGGAPGPR